MYETIVVATDGSEQAQSTVDHAATLAASVGATLHVVSVVETRSNPMKFGVEDVAELNEAAGELVDEVVEFYDDIDVRGEVRRGNPTEVLLEYVEAVDADLLVVGKSGTDRIEAALLGSTTDRLARMTEIPLTIVPHSDEE
jgi:nucleotide-binding universal stress UspA family protein